MSGHPHLDGAGAGATRTPLRRIAVTRDEGPGGELARALRARGLEPVPCPVIAAAGSPEPARLREAARRLERYDWLLVASRRALEALMEARDRRPIPGSVRTAATGSRTADALRRHGAREPWTGARAGAAALIERLRGGAPWLDRRCLLPRALEGRDELADALRRWGAAVDEVVAYRTVARAPSEILAAWNAARPDAVVVASPSAARALVRAVGAPPLRERVAVVAIGPTTGDALAGLGVPARIPRRADFEAVAEMLSIMNTDRGECP